MGDYKCYSAGSIITDDNGKSLFRLEADTVYNDKFYIVRATDLLNNRACLLKFTNDEEGYKRANLTREGSFRFFHPYIERTYGVFSGKTPDDQTVDGVSVEYVEGTDLEEYRENLEDDLVAGTISETQLDYTIFRQILQLLHAMKYYTDFAEDIYLHRDIKPKNIMITELGDVKLVDFDYAHIAGSTKTVSTSEIFWNMGFSSGYTSPEIFDKDRKWSNLTTELYSAGRTIFYWLNGQHYYTNDQISRTSSAEWGKYCSEDSLKYGFSANSDRFRENFLSDKYSGLLRIMNKMCASPEEERYKSVDEVIEDMELFLLGYCGNSWELFEEHFGTKCLKLLHDPAPEFNTRKHIMTAYRIDGGRWTGRPLYTYTVRDIMADGRRILMIYNLDNDVYCIPVQGGYTFRNDEPIHKGYQIKDGDIITFDKHTIEFRIEEKKQ